MGETCADGNKHTKDYVNSSMKRRERDAETGQKKYASERRGTLAIALPYQEIYRFEDEDEETAMGNEDLLARPRMIVSAKKIPAF